MRFYLVLTFVTFFAVSCSSSKKPREFKLPYKVINASDKIEPDWLNNAQKYEDKKKGMNYFVSSSEHATKRLCIKSSEARASAAIAGEVAQEIRSDYSEVTREEDEETVRYMSESLKQVIQTEVSGIKTVLQYWEQRKFEEDENGITKVDYSCFTLVGIPEKRLSKAIKLAQKKALSMVPNADVKAKLQAKFDAQ